MNKHVKGCKYSGNVPVNMCPCECTDEQSTKPFWIKKAKRYWRFKNRQHYLDYCHQCGEYNNNGGKIPEDVPFQLAEWQMQRRLVRLRGKAFNYTTE